MKKSKKAFIIILVLLSFTGCWQNKLYRDSKFILGTVVEVVSPYPEAADIAFKEIMRIEQVLSMFIADSAVSHLNKTGFLNTSFEVAWLVEKSKIFYELTGGKFDITVGAITKMWKEAIKENRIPDEKEIKRNLKLVGFNRVFIDKINHIIKFKNKGIQIDLGAIAKGYAVDAAVKELKRKGIDSAIINAGGDLFCLGSRFGRPWQVNLQNPRKAREVIRTLKVSDLAVATCTDYEKHKEVKGRRYLHIIDPKTGYPIENNVVSVTVIAKDAVTADAVATSVFLLGKDKGIKVFRNYDGVKEIIVITQNNAESVK